MDTLWIETLQRVVQVVDEKLAAANAEQGEYSHTDYDGWRRRTAAAQEKLIAYFTNEEGARFNDRPAHEVSVKMAGVRATSTGGTTAALRNWHTAACKRIAADDGFNPHGSGPVTIEPREAGQ
ncbi:hypothetical protein X747_14990 [Mesorhizobium sp. LNJC384A00]|uniref:hypothetical protein n=1 Tax=unclassified Mesorhizobium TaxID=325217 RepID=UPI0003CF632A|nr:hypothetical protein [Mesorhizobium sp. LNJC384A00]ESY42069.1 hypothetical protein X747_14990 [Mesorhizobium sp. LNJC384A00]